MPLLLVNGNSNIGSSRSPFNVKERGFPANPFNSKRYVSGSISGTFPVRMT